MKLASKTQPNSNVNSPAQSTSSKNQVSQQDDVGYFTFFPKDGSEKMGSTSFKVKELIKE